VTDAQKIAKWRFQTHGFLPFAVDEARAPLRPSTPLATAGLPKRESAVQIGAGSTPREVDVFSFGFVAPVLALVSWTLVVWVWMYATRLPAMQRAKLGPQSAKHPGSLNVLPTSARQVADNYNHLMEQPTIFYAAALAAHTAGAIDVLAIGFAWAFVGLRVVHSLVQGTVNIVPLRFLMFALSTFALAGLVVRTCMLLLAG
jgi:hypothetical protein